jgi:hypothetical protein
MLLTCFKCGKKEEYNESQISHITTLILNKNKYIDKKYSCFKCSPEYMVQVKSYLLKNKQFDIKKCELCNKPTVENVGSFSPYLCYQNNKFLICCKCIFN